MAAPGTDKKHLVPLLEFLRFVSEQAKGNKNRFPKKINGAAELSRDFPYWESEPDSLSASPEYAVESANSGSYNNSPSLSQEGSASFTVAGERRKRLRSPESNHEVAADSANVPVECEVVVKTPDKGFSTTKYVDFSLCDLGLEVLIDVSRHNLTKEIAKQLTGVRCCYLLLGTSMVVTGDIVDVSITGESVLVSPDRGLKVGIEWVPLKRVFQVPENIGAVREEAAHRIERIIDAERRGEKTPRISPVQLAKRAAISFFPSSPERQEMNC
jgi:hypothetical protein